MIVVNLDVMMAKRKISLNELSERVGITITNLSKLKTGKAKAIRFTTLDAICKALDCTPADILDYSSEKEIDEKDHYFCDANCYHNSSIASIGTDQSQRPCG